MTQQFHPGQAVVFFCSPTNNRGMALQVDATVLKVGKRIKIEYLDQHGRSITSSAHPENLAPKD